MVLAGVKMEDEVVIIEVKRRLFDIVNKPGRASYWYTYDRDVYEANRAITRSPEFLAIRDAETLNVEMLFKIDQSKSDFGKGQIVTEGDPKGATIHLRTSMDISLTHNIVWYARFKTLLTHESTKEFTEEKSPIINHVVLEENEVLLCNGYSCIHFSYCKFFNNSQSPFTTSTELNSEVKGHI
jgi:hypothetical protein